MFVRVSLVLIVSVLSLMLSCGKSQLDGKPTAIVEPSAGPSPVEQEATGPAPAGAKTPADAELPASPAAPAAADNASSTDTVTGDKPVRDLVLDPRRSTVGFVGRKLTGDHEGSFAQISGTAQLRGYDLVAFSVIVQTGAVVADHPDLTNHLKSADFFNSSKYPIARFISKTLRAATEGTASHTVSGELSLLAITKRITFPATIVITDTGATGVAEFKINRKDFGIVYPGKPDDLIADEVLLKLNLAFAHKT